MISAGDAGPPPDPVRQLLRHTLATLAYRGGKAVRGAPPDFSSFRAAEGTRTPGQVLAHIGDLLDWALSLASGAHVWKETPPGAWDRDVERFFAGLRRFDEALASPAPLGYPPGKLFQGPIADALAHVGQIALMRRMAGAPVRGENYFKADIAAGRVGAGQSPPRFEFD
ncbi:MAG TPA: hypothetical protein VIZ58_13410 [Thermoanaerobaculia bacterium]